MEQEESKEDRVQIMLRRILEQAEDKEGTRRIWRPAAVFVKSGLLFRKEKKKLLYARERPAGRRQLTEEEKKVVEERAEAVKQRRKRGRSSTPPRVSNL